MKIEFKALCLVALVCMFATVAGADDGKIWKTLTAEQLAGMMKEWGYRADTEASDTGRHYISSSTGGTNFTIVFYDSTTDGVYEDIHMGAWFNDSFEGTIADANNWNLKKRHAYAIYDGSDNTSGLQMDLTVKGGVTEEYLKAYFRMWEGYLNEFEGYLAAAH